MSLIDEAGKAAEQLIILSKQAGIDIKGGKIRRTSSRFCLGVEHGDYNGTELFGVGTDRFIWMGYKTNDVGRMRLFSGNFIDEGVIEFQTGKIPEPKSIVHSWARFPCGVDYVLRKRGYKLNKGIDAVIYGNIPGGGMSRSASLSINLITSLLDANNIVVKEPFEIVEMAQAAENEYIGSPCGQLDPIMIFFAKAGMGTHYKPQSRTIEYVPLGKNAEDFCFVAMDTGTVRPGLEKSTYKIRRAECEELASILQKDGYKLKFLGDVKDISLYKKIIRDYGQKYPNLCKRLKYIYEAQNRFYKMLDAWKSGDIATVGQIFREDGYGLRDDYEISGPELETMCEIARTVPGVLGERMLGGGDKGASGAIVLAIASKSLQEAVAANYPRKYPEYKDKYALHTCRVVDGVTVYNDLLRASNKMKDLPNDSNIF